MYDRMNLMNNNLYSCNKTGHGKRIYRDGNGKRCSYIGGVTCNNEECNDYNSCCKHSLPPGFIPCGTNPCYPCNCCCPCCGQVVPTGPMPPVPPIPPTPPIPPIPPIPPAPPVPILGEGIFEANEVIADGRLYTLNTVVIEGNDIRHGPGLPIVDLAPNRTYLIDWSSVTIINAAPFEVGGALILNGVAVPGGTSTTDMLIGPGQALNVVNNLVINTGAVPSQLSLAFISNIGQLPSELLLNIRVIG